MEYSTAVSVKGTLVVGIDEAGRGSLVGDMFIAGVCVRIDKLSRLKDIGVRDSKQLTPKRRDELFNIIVSEIEYYTVRRIPPPIIDRENLNNLLYDNIADILAELVDKCENITYVYIDLTGNKRKLLEIINRRLGRRKWVIIAEHKADQKYVAVSIASIIAKVLRDRHIHELSKRYGKIGSGYPADPRTIEWLRNYLEEHRNIPVIVRRTWHTIKELAPSYYIEKSNRREFITLDHFFKTSNKNTAEKSKQ